MPVFRNQGVVELIRGVKAFFSFEVGVTRGQVPRAAGQGRLREEPPGGDRVRKLEASVRNLKEELEQREDQLKQARLRMAEKDRQIARSVLDFEVKEGQGVEQVVDDFHRLYYNSNTFGGTWRDTFWMGVPIWKCPLDMWIYQEILFDVRPDVIVETGTAFGGSALFLANVCDLLGKGKVVTVDIQNRPNRPRHERIQYISGSSTADDVVEQVHRDIDGGKVLVILDSDHSKGHVLEELMIYSRFVQEGSYVIVEDSNVNGHPVMPEFGPGPMEAIQDFLKENQDFVVDESKEKFYMTFNPRGYLKKVR
jgi:cephalosporin hydroxylase